MRCITQYTSMFCIVCTCAYTWPCVRCMWRMCASHYTYDMNTNQNDIHTGVVYSRWPYPHNDNTPITVDCCQIEISFIRVFRFPPHYSSGDSIFLSPRMSGILSVWEGLLFDGDIESCAHGNNNYYNPDVVTPFQRPVQRCGATQVITNDRGHLLKSSMKSCEHPLGTFRGTWSMTKNDMVKTVPAIKRTTAPFSTTSRTDATMAHSAPDRVLNWFVYLARERHHKAILLEVKCNHQHQQNTLLLVM